MIKINKIKLIEIRSSVKKWIREYLVERQGIVIILPTVAIAIGLFVVFNPNNMRLRRSLDKDYLYQASSNNITVSMGARDTGRPTVKAEVGETSIIFTYQDSVETKTKPIKKGNTLLFKDVVPNADLTYQTIPNGVKEELILKSAPDSHFFIFQTEIEGLGSPKVVTTDTLQPVIYDEDGNYLFHFEKPFAYDASGARTDNAIVQLRPSPTNPNYFKTIVAVDKSWLFSPDRVYPITIDPTIVHDTSDEFATGTLNRAKDTGTTSAPTIETWYQELARDKDTALLWHFNEGTGSTTADTSGNSLTGTVTNATWTTTAQLMGNAAVSFDGTGDFVSRADNDLLDFAATDSFTIEAWVKTNGTMAGQKYIVVKAGSTGPGYKLYMNLGGFIFAIDDDATWTPDDNAGTSFRLYDDSRWHHVAGVKNGTQNIILYVDGEQAQIDKAIAATGTLANTGTFYVGIDRDGTSNAWDGQIDGVRVSRVARTAEEIKYAASRVPYSVYTSSVIDLYEETLAFDELNWNELGVATGDGETVFDSTGLVAQWNFNETSGTTADNAEGTAALDGTLSGFDSTASQDADPDSSWTANNRRWGAGALMFDGTDSHVEVADNASLMLTGDFTISAWVNRNRGTTDGTIIAKKGATGTGGFQIFHDNAGKVYCRTDTGAAAVTSATNSFPYVHKSSGWTYLTVIKSGTDCRIYINGADQTTTFGTHTTVGSNSLPLRIGSTSADTLYFNGAIDAVQVYSRAWSANEVMNNYNATNVEFQTRVGPDTSPDDGNWDSWTPTSGETQIQSFDADASNWSWDSLVDTSIVSKADDTTTFYEGSGALKLTTGSSQTDGNTVALWRMDETNGDNAGVDVFDTTSNNLDLEIVGTNLATGIVDGVIGKARDFNGTDDSLSIADNPLLDFAAAGTFTISAWVKHDGAIATNPDYLIVKAGSTGPGYKVYMDNSGDFCFAVDDDTTWTPDDSACTSAIDYDDNKWHHVVGVKDGTSSIKLYVDGVLVATDASIAATGTLENTGIFYIGVDRDGTSNEWDGKIDEVSVHNVARNAGWVAETYRMGRDHYLSRTISSTDLTSKGKLAFNVAADRPGTYLEATIGENAYANASPGVNTQAYWRFDEHANDVCNTGTNDVCDSSGNGIHGDESSSPPIIPGLRSYARDFDGSADNISFGASTNLLRNKSTASASVWIKADALSGTPVILDIADGISTNSRFKIAVGTNISVSGSSTDGETLQTVTSGAALVINSWYNIVGTIDYTNDSIKIYLNGVELSTTGTVAFGANTTSDTSPTAVYIGQSAAAGNRFDGTIDEVSVYDTLLTVADARQIFESRLRTYPITIDFAAKLTTTDLITGSSDTSFQIDETLYGATERSQNLYPGDKIIVRETFDDTTYTAQGTVISTRKSSGDTMVASWDSGSTFPSAGFTTNASVFKWQTEYFDINNLTLDSFMDGITNISMRVTNGNEGRTVWLDDLKSVSDYLTTPSGSTITSDVGERYFQYRAILSSSDEAVSATMSAVTVDYQSSAAAGHWKFDEGVNDTCSGGTNDTCDSSINSNDGAITGATWQTRDMCASGRCLFFDGSDDVVTITSSDDISLSGQMASAFTIAAWAKPNSDGEGSVGEIWNKGTNNYARITNEGTDGFADLEIKVDLATTDATVTITNGITLDTFNHVAVTYTDDGDDEVSVYINGLLRGTSTDGDGAPATDANNLLIGGATGANFHGFIDDFKMFEVEKTEAEIKTLYIKDASTQGSSVSFDDPLTDGLNGYWELDESSGNATDSSGNGLTLTNNGTTTFTPGKFGNGSEHVPASSQYLSTATAIDNVKTVSFWVNPDSTTNYFIDLDGGTSYISATSGTISTGGFANPIIYVNGAITTTLAADTWQFVTVTTNTEIDASAFKVGLIGDNYFDGTMDEVRVYNRTLSEMEVVSLYNWAPGPVGYWPLDENTYQETVGYTTPTFDAMATTGSAGSQNNLTASITVGNNSNRIILVGVSTRAQAVSSVVFDSGGANQLTLTQFSSATRTDASAYLYYGLAPAVGTYNVTVNLAASDVHAFSVVTYYGVDQTVPLLDSTSTTGSAAGADALTVPTSARAIAIDVLSKRNSLDTPLVVSPQTERAKVVGTGGGDASNRMWSAISENTTTPSASMDWTWSNARDYAFLAASINGTPYPTTKDKAGSNNAYLRSITSSSWVPGRYGSALELNGSADFIDVGTGPTQVNTVSFWVYPTTINEYFINLTSTTDYIWVDAGTITATGLASPTIYVNGVETSTLVAGEWQHITVTTTTAEDASNLEFGRTTNTNYLQGKIDDIRLYDYVRTPAQIIEDMNGGHPVGGSPVGSQVLRYKFDELNQSTAYNTSSLNPSDTPNTTSLEHWFSMDEASGNRTDTHASYTLTDTNTVGSATGKQDNAALFVRTNSEALVGADQASVSFGNEDFTVGGWVNLTTASNWEALFGKWDEASNLREWNVIYNSFSQRFTFQISSSGSGSSSIGADQLGIPSTDTWYFVVAWHDATANTINIQINNGTADSTSYSNGSADRASRFVIGAQDEGAGIKNYSDSTIDEVFIYRRVLTDLERSWLYNNGSGQTYENLSNIDVSGSISGATWKHGSDCKVSGCLDFDGTDDVVTTTNANSIDFDTGLSQAVTFSAWINADSDGENDVGQIFNKGTTTYCRTTNESAGLADLECSLDLGTTDATVTVTDGITINAWHHIAMVYQDDADDEIEVYIDGILRGTSTNGVGSPATGDTNNLLIGGSSAANFDGTIDEFQVYSAALTAAQVRIVYNANSQASLGGVLGATEKSTLTDGAGSNPIGWWKLDENTGTASTYDSSGNSYTGSLTSIAESSWVPGKLGSALNFDGSADFVDIGTGPSSVKTVTFWVYPETTTEYFVNLTSTTDYIWADAGVVTATGFSTPTIYVDGIATTTLVAGSWQHIVVVSDTAENASNMDIGRTADANYLQGKIDEVKMFDYALTQAQAAYEYNRGGPVGWWRMDEGTGTTTTYDASGKGYNLTMNTMTEADWVTGKYSTALDFDGGSDYLSCTDAACGGTTKLDFAAANNLSFSAWMKTATTGTQMTIMGKKLSTAASRAGYRMGTATNGSIKCTVSDGTNQAEPTATINTTDSAWHHVACVVDGTNIYTYVDGKLNGSASVASVTGSLDNVEDFKIGDQGNASAKFTGQIDDSRVYNYALSQKQIKEIMNYGAQRFGN